MSVKILLIDPSLHWLLEAKNFFTEHEYDVVTANDGRNAQLAFFKEKDKFFTAVLNLDVKNHDGPTVLKYIKANRPTMRIILTMESGEKLESMGLSKKTLEKQGIVDVFFHPFELKKLKEAVEDLQDERHLAAKAPQREGQTDEEEVSANDQQFSSVPIDDFISSKAVQFDIYVRLTSGRYVKILHAGDSFSKDRINKYKNDHHVKELYFLSENRIKYIRLQNFILDKAVESEKIALESKVQLSQKVSELFFEEIYTEGIKPQSLEQGKALCQNLYGLVNNNKNLGVLLKDFRDFDPTAYTHGYLVTLYSTMLVKQLEWDSKVVNETVGMAAIFHDIGKTKLPKNLVHLRPGSMTEVELKEYKNHPVIGSEIMSSKNLVPSVVRQIILQHHEKYNGKGFPNGIKKHNILNFSRVIILVDEFVHLLVDNKCAPPAALKLLLSDVEAMEKHGSQLLENFLKMFINPDKMPATTRGRHL